jgi:tRNA G18 (ribose-2'-O)-methylase SpoU
MSVLNKIRQAGFTLELSGDGFDVTGIKPLTDEQREFIRSHKAEIINELQAEQQRDLINAERTTSEIVKQLVRCWTPAGIPIDVEARDQAHAAFLRKMNPEPNHD